MDIKHLQWFMETVKEKSINKAAEKLFITPSALSARLVKIEDEVGCQLLKRSHNGIELTTEGQYFYEDACKICDINASWTYLNQRHGADKEKIYLAAFPTVYNTVFPRLVTHLVTENGPFDIYTYQYDVLKIETAFYQRKITLGITAIDQDNYSSADTFARNLNLRLCTLGNDAFGIYVANGHPLYERESVQLDELSPFLHVTTFNAAFKKMGLHRFNNGSAVNVRGQQNQLAYILAHPQKCYGTYPALLQHSPILRAYPLRHIPLAQSPLQITYVSMYDPNALSSFGMQVIPGEVKQIFHDMLADLHL